MKRFLDIVVSSGGLLLLAPIFGAVAVLVRLDSPGPVFFRQERIGRGMRPFSIYKFRTMVAGASRYGLAVTAAGDARITRVGRFLRKTKLDELPQLINVFRGEMSLVGPRPELRRYVDLFRRDYEEILTVRPGITDFASLKYRHEERILGLAKDPEQQYTMHILPDKILLSKQYARRSSIALDVSLIAKTLKAVLLG